MTSRDLLRAIAETDEAYLLESERFSAIGAGIKADRKRLRQRVAAMGIVAVLCIAVFGIIKLAPQAFRSGAPSDLSDASTRNTDHPSAPETSETASETGAASNEHAASATSGEPASATARETERPASTTERQTQPPTSGNAERRETKPEPSATRAPDETSVPHSEQKTEAPADVSVPPAKEDPPSQASSQPTTAAEPVSPSAEPTTDSPTSADGPGSPGAVFTSVNVSYAQAKEKFGHPILPCASEGFTGYSVGIVSRNGDINASGAFCLSVTYTFTNGSVSLDDQDRWNSSSFSTYGEAYVYRGRTFYVQTPDVSRDYIHIGYWPSQDRGIGYQAHFDGSGDIYEIMDLILSVEI